MNKRVTIEEKSVTRAANGEEVVTWIVHADVWASVTPIRGREFFAAAQTQGAADVRVTIRHRQSVTRAMRVIYGGHVLDIDAEPINIMSRNEFTELMCVAGVKNG